MATKIQATGGTLHLERALPLKPPSSLLLATALADNIPTASLSLFNY
jgi:hypothetical protein